MSISPNQAGYVPTQTPQLDEQQKAFLLSIANSNNSDLNNIARQQATHDFVTSPTRKATHAVGTMIPYVDSFLRGAATPGSFSTKTLTGLDTGKDWGVFILATKAYNKGIEKIISKSPKAREFTENHPALTFTGMLVTSVMFGRAAINLVNQGINKALKLNPAEGETLITALDRKFGERLNNTLGAQMIQNKIFKPIEEFAKKPIANRLLNVAAIGLGLLIIKNIYDVYKMKKNADKSYGQLQDARFESTKTLANQLAVENSILKSR